MSGLWTAPNNREKVSIESSLFFGDPVAVRKDEKAADPRSLSERLGDSFSVQRRQGQEEQFQACQGRQYHSCLCSGT